MRIGFVGLGKLGLPCAVAIAGRGHNVYGYDMNTALIEQYKKGISNLYEPDLDEKLRDSNINFTSLDEVVSNSEIIFVAVQTPHSPELDGTHRHNGVKKDFDYTYLLSSMREVVKFIDKCSQYKTVVIVSTVLPGTTREIIYPAVKDITSNPWGLCYNPSFIAMGQVIKDYLNPEFTLIGEREPGYSGNILTEFYSTIHNSPKLRMTWDEAEMVKMTYNTYIGFKIIFANTIMQACYSVGANCDVVTSALTKATDRLMNGKYLRGGMGDGGGCHPRDNLALSYLSDKLGLSYNIFEFVMDTREKQTEWIADLACSYNMPIVILGKTFKPNTNLTDGSPSILLANILEERGKKVTFYDPITNPELLPNEPSVYVIGTSWPQFKDFEFSPGSVVIDPWRFIDKVPENVELVSIGRKSA